MNLLSSITYKYKTANIVHKIIAINIIVFVLMHVAKTISFLMAVPETQFYNWFFVSKNLDSLLFKPWTLISYSFFHSGLWHIFGNMLLLYYAGHYFLNYFTPKRFLNFYFMGAISGALVFALSFNFFPQFSGSNPYLLGASAAVTAVLVGIATHTPNMSIRLILLGSIKFWHIAAILVLKDLVQIPAGNAGGHLAHLGGAALGFVYARQLAKGHDIGKWFENLMEGFFSIFRSKKNRPLKTVYKKKNTKRTPRTTSSKREHQKKIDAILDKISKSGYESLTKTEKDFLFKAGKD
ncbi:MAG: rhomboid family intramembrane serine protease [Flavobacteriaceae bacterium]|nr:rhomboid family intramembrane serine protease [Flavobacteriaceae bacterium]